LRDQPKHLNFQPQRNDCPHTIPITKTTTSASVGAFRTITEASFPTKRNLFKSGFAIGGHRTSITSLRHLVQRLFNLCILEAVRIIRFKRDVDVGALTYGTVRLRTL
jgi:hypothetical protein